MDDPRPGFGATARRFAARARSRGIGEVAREIAGATRGRLSSEGVLRFLTRGTTGDVEPSIPELSFRRADLDDAAGYAREVGTDSSGTFIARLDRTNWCYLAEVGGRIVHASWATTSGAWIGEIGRYFVVPEGGLYVYESWTSPEARGRGIYPDVLRRIAADVAPRGIDEIWIGVGEGNRPSVRAIEKAGFVVAFEIAFRRRAGRISLEAPVGPRSEAFARVIHESWPRRGVVG
jgi:ribosomal protein S18 acetylase RimI-like enzyme